MDYWPLNDTERSEPINSLRGNAQPGQVLLMDRRDTGFTGTRDEVADDDDQRH